MKSKRSTEEVIADMLRVQYEQIKDARARHFYRETLHALVRLAKSEMRLEIKNNVRKLTMAHDANREKMRILADAERQQRFEFHDR
jgi:hypothetical protein